MPRLRSPRTVTTPDRIAASRYRRQSFTEQHEAAAMSLIRIGLRSEANETSPDALA
ncbi:hypothetical protein [Streptomyces umbrinus]|uniref:hypothetical protein n=1 Tax=Streptomyces umbrinus TaxID=67370 RepID=UPI003C2C0D64